MATLPKVLINRPISNRQGCCTSSQNSGYHTNSALYPLVEAPLRLAAGGRRRGPPRQARKRAGALSVAPRGGRAAVGIAAVIAGRRWLSEAESRRRNNSRSRRGDALFAMSPEEAERQPLLEVWEDVHWADPSTLDLLGQLIDQVPNVPLFGRADLSPGIYADLAGALACPALDPQPARTAAVAAAMTADPNRLRARELHHVSAGAPRECESVYRQGARRRG